MLWYIIKKILNNFLIISMHIYPKSVLSVKEHFFLLHQIRNITTWQFHSYILLYLQHVSLFSFTHVNTVINYLRQRPVKFFPGQEYYLVHIGVSVVSSKNFFWPPKPAGAVVPTLLSIMSADWLTEMKKVCYNWELKSMIIILVCKRNS